jgi:hypothetical protein
MRRSTRGRKASDVQKESTVKARSEQDSLFCHGRLVPNQNDRSELASFWVARGRRRMKKALPVDPWNGATDSTDTAYALPRRKTKQRPAEARIDLLEPKSHSHLGRQPRADTSIKDGGGLVCY